MTKPNISALSPLPTLTIQQYERYLPTAFDNSLTLLEKLNMAIIYLNQIGELTNEVVAQWNEVMEWIMAEGLEVAVNEKLDAWEEDGTLASIINVDLLNLKADKTYVDTELGKKATTETVALKADKTYVDTELGKKATTETVALKADKTYVDTEILSVNKEIDILYNNVVYVESFPRLAGETDDSPRINRAIEASTMNSKVKFANKIYELKSSSIKLLPDRVYEGEGWQTIFKQVNGANLPQLIEFKNVTQLNSNVEIKNFSIDGNKQNNNSAHGMYIWAMVTSTIENIKIENCPQTAIFMDGSSSLQGSTCHLRNCNIESNGGYGIHISLYNQDMHIYGGDIGLNGFENIYIASPSSSVRDATAWASQNSKSGIYIHANAIACQVMNCQTEGNAGHGIEVYADHVMIVGNKIYDNANVGANYGLYDGIYVGAVKNVSILSNLIFSGLYNQTGYYRHGITLDVGHNTANLFGNSIKFMGNGSINEAIPSVYGLVAGDYTDYSWSTQSKVV